ncbi:sensor histidine kinase [Chitinophaga sp. 22620]|uniref:sensor histidine kinase n=1 Tax=Chitinophaga sp. 22620 TaxID=3453952 RepID=UPI003F8686ED
MQQELPLPFKQHTPSRFPLYYEGFIWLMYVVIWKYDYYLGMLPRMTVPGGQFFPFNGLLLYAIATSLYMVLYYRLLAPALFTRRRYGLFVLAAILFFAYASKLNYWAFGKIFLALNQQPLLQDFYIRQDHFASIRIQHFLTGWDLRLLAIEFAMFTSIFFVRYAFRNEARRRQLETDNLQLDSLKAQLQPHFLFNTLNSLYAMSLQQSKETPAFILRLSDMLRFILYDCQESKVPVEKDVAFIQHYIEMEKKRYPDAVIDFTVEVEGNVKVVPLLCINFLENSFKYGAHRITNNGFVRGKLVQRGGSLLFRLENDIFPLQENNTNKGGIGIENVKRRLALYYPGKHHLTIQERDNIFIVELSIQLN